VADWKSGDGKRSAPTFIKPKKEMVFASLHHHSTFSYLDGYGTPESHVARAAELGMTSMALTEHGNVTSHVQLEQAAKRYDVKPVFGCELYTGEVGEGATRRKNHLTVLAENVKGYQNLLELVSKGWSEGFYSEPTVSGNMFVGRSDGLIVLSGCSGSLLSTSIIGGKNVPEEDASYARGKRVAEKAHDFYGPGNYFLEVQAFPELEKTRNINQALAIMSEQTGIPLVATLDAHYTAPSESEMQMILHNLRPGKVQTIEEQARSWGYDVPLTMLTDRQLYDRLVATGLTRKQAEQAIRNAREIADRCNVEIPKVDNLRYPLPPGMDDPVQLFRQWIQEGWSYRGFGHGPECAHTAHPHARHSCSHHLSEADTARYEEQLKMEMDLIIDKGFVDYFLVEADQVKWAKDRGIPVGPARGSAAASLVCYLMRITEVNPMLFPNLLFERFIDANRFDLPDIDLDFDDERRWEVRQYLSRKYGEDRVGQIGTFTRFKGKNSLDDTGRVFRIPAADIATVKELLIERSSGDLRANATIEDTIEMFPQVREVFERHPDLYKAQLLEGNVKSMSVHAAGLVIANSPLTDFCAVYTKIDRKTGLPVIDVDTGDVAQIVSLDKRDAEYLNVMKLDNLGLKTMGAIRIFLELLEESGHLVNGRPMTLQDVYRVPLDDEETIQGFKEGDVIGVFQFDGRAMRNVNEGVVPDNFFEVCDINALARPGPLHSGASGLYMDAKHGRIAPVHYHPIIDQITKETQFQIVYQEQILQVVRMLGNFSWEEAARIRKIISKKRGEQEFNQQRDKFVAGAIANGMDEEGANKVFSMLATAGAYAFNAAHCVSYGMLAYWTMWMKRHYPTFFYAAMLRKFGHDKSKRDQLLKDVIRKGIPIDKFNLNKSGYSWTVSAHGIRPGYVQIEGIGPANALLLLAAREELGGFESWKQVGATKGIGAVKIQKMKDFFSSEDPFGMSIMKDKLDALRELLRQGVQDGEGSPFMLPETTHTSSQVPYERTEGHVPVVWCGFVKTRNIKDLFELHHSRTGNVLRPEDAYRPELSEWVVMNAEDDDDVITLTIDRYKYSQFKERAWSLRPGVDIVLVKGVKKANQARRAVYISQMWVINPETMEVMQ
jgi:DNA polymerase-3 subunit alpha